MSGSKSILLEVNDNGVGFDTTQNQQGNGLKNMQKRAAELNGELRVISTSGKGTLVQLMFELK